MRKLHPQICLKLGMFCMPASHPWHPSSAHHPLAAALLVPLHLPPGSWVHCFSGLAAVQCSNLVSAVMPANHAEKGLEACLHGIQVGSGLMHMPPLTSLELWWCYRKSCQAGEPMAFLEWQLHSPHFACCSQPAAAPQNPACRHFCSSPHH